MSLPGPSSLGRIAACPTSEAHPHARSSSEHAKRGDVVHAFLAACVTLGRDAALLAAALEHRDSLEAIPPDRLPPLDSKHSAPEVSFALDLKTGECRELGRNLSREEARAKARDGEMVGTADLVGLTVDTAVIYDWKTGRGHVDRAEVNWQVKTYGLMAARTYARENAKASIVRVLDDGTVWYDTVEMDGLDLDAHEAELRALMSQRDVVLALPADKRPQLHEGEHCRYCPALPFCPAKQTLLATVVAAPEPLTAQTLELTPERAAKAWERIEAGETLLVRLKAVLKDYARQHPFPVGDGYVVGEVTETREAIVADRARKALEQHLGGQLGGVVFSESVETKTSITKTALKSALTKYVLPTMPKESAKISHLEKAVLETLRKNGAVSVTSFQHVKEHKAKEEKAAPKALEAPKPEEPPGEAWSKLTPEGKLDYGRNGDIAAAAERDAKRRAERERLMRECELSPRGHEWSRMGSCLHCNLEKPPLDGNVDMSSGHPIRYGVKLCGCQKTGKPCVDLPKAAPELPFATEGAP